MWHPYTIRGEAHSTRVGTLEWAFDADQAVGSIQTEFSSDETKCNLCSTYVFILSEISLWCTLHEQPVTQRNSKQNSWQCFSYQHSVCHQYPSHFTVFWRGRGCKDQNSLQCLSWGHQAPVEWHCVIFWHVLCFSKKSLSVARNFFLFSVLMSNDLPYPLLSSKNSSKAGRHCFLQRQKK